MQLINHDAILEAIESRREALVTFRSKEDGGAILARRCAPMDYGPSRRAHDKTPRYHFWDWESDSPSTHTLSLLATQIVSVEVLDSDFDPASFIPGTPNWFVERTTWEPFN